MRRPVLTLAALTALAAGTFAPAQAITDGEPDTDHTYAAMLVVRDAEGGFLWTCSGSFLDADTVLTAGHCAEPPAHTVEVRLGEGPLSPATEPVGVGGVVLHPSYDPTDFSAHDLAVVELDEPVGADVLDRFAQLPEQDVLDALEPSVDTTFTAVGYGLTRASTPQAGRQESPFVRMTAEPRLLKINHQKTGEGSFLVSANSHTGGTCSGDSGGPVLLPGTDVVAGVVSYGNNPLCGGQSGIYRVDRADDLAFLAPYVG